MSEDSKKLNKRSYNLHYKIRKQGFKLQTRRKLIFTGTQELTAQVIKLNKEFKYVLQPSLF